jgi:hypothetical protein
MSSLCPCAGAACYRSEAVVLAETSEYKNKAIPEAKNNPPTTAKDMKARVLFQQKLNASTTSATMSSIPEA